MSQRTMNLYPREIFLILSLFIFTSLLMFTVGIVVGKGLKNGNTIHPEIKAVAPKVEEPHHPPPPVVAVKPASVAPRVEIPTIVEPEESKREEEPLDLTPKAGEARTNYGSLQEPSHASDTVFNNPKIKAIVEDEPKEVRKITAVAKDLPPSFAMGKYTVQVGSYANAKDAKERVENLKKMGFLHAYLSAKELGGKNNTWYRVWLGYYPDYNSAEASGKALLNKQEIRNYLVRKTGKDQ